MNLPRRGLLRLACSALAALNFSQFAWALDYPTRQVRVIVPFAAGGGTDVAARLIGQYLTERLGQPFVVENRPGGGTNIATELVVNAPPDGYTLLMVSPSSAINATLYQKLNFNFIRDIAPVASIMNSPLLMEVNPSFPAQTVPQFIAYAKANPAKVSMASAGTGSSVHLSGELFKMMAGIDMVHVPYRGEAPALTDLLGGQVQVLFGSAPPAIENIKAGKLRVLAVTTTHRWQAMPDIPTVNEFLPGYETSVWFGIAAPRNTPMEIVNVLNREINAALADSKIKSRFADLGAVPFVVSPAQFGKFLTDETEKWGKVVKASGARQD